MATVTWNGTTTSTDYNYFGNWIPGFVPGGSDTATFGTGTGTTVTIAANSTVLAWQFTGGGYTNTITNAARLEFTGAGGTGDQRERDDRSGCLWNPPICWTERRRDSCLRP